MLSEAGDGSTASFGLRKKQGDGSIASFYLPSSSQYFNLSSHVLAGTNTLKNKRSTVHEWDRAPGFYQNENNGKIQQLHDHSTVFSLIPRPYLGTSL
ncbi:hypothetical protein D1B31_18795 [Neobacillus notoginsengisoli]|uniref:Uncharacterized protein n=1 Tax=Neobacillus notoginsengisoli TaxID=1578198 RepID=A0A417YPD2_9BACI|nr:hypothetical protein [Neobacillus notoginsengisoli]RHW35691.1 hypothetical protein D1B31_18795 [Neobacillus notoginsengisoli]